MAVRSAKTSPQASFARKRRGAGMGKRRDGCWPLVLDGVDRKTAAENCGMDRQTLRDWAHRYNAEGVSGLFNRRPPDPPCLLSAAQKEELAEMVRAGPDPETDGVVRWRRIDLKRKIEERFGVTMHERTVGKQLASLLSACRFRNPTRMHRRLLKKLRRRGRSSLGKQPGKPLEIWFQDEARVASRARSTWNTPPCPARHPVMAPSARNGLGRSDHATCRHTGHERALAEIAKTVASGAHALLILDGLAGIRQSWRYDNITLPNSRPIPLNSTRDLSAPTSSPYPSSTIMSRSSTGVAKHGTSLQTAITSITMGQNGQRLGPLV